ncbi:MAG: DUF805 domain-containing protein [Alphaproteobacteria bacterium]|nr:DUF805 domain-containing protein [Alphaproteobacteria bacterium]MDE2631145.1 DUF805 domain-containing protein [Alphaproteobacteria bacterium]
MDPNAVIEVFRRNVTEHYFDLKGRVGRQEFWYFVLACFVLFIGAWIVDRVIGIGLLSPVLGLALLLPMTGMGARRLQDIGRNGSLVWVWAIISAVAQVFGLLMALAGPYGALGALYFLFTFGWLLGLVSLASLAISIVLIYFWVQPGAAGANEYGPDPNAAAAAPKAA